MNQLLLRFDLQLMWNKKARMGFFLYPYNPVTSRVIGAKIIPQFWRTCQAFLQIFFGCGKKATRAKKSTLPPHYYT